MDCLNTHKTRFQFYHNQQASVNTGRHPLMPESSHTLVKIKKQIFKKPNPTKKKVQKISGKEGWG